MRKTFLTLVFVFVFVFVVVVVAAGLCFASGVEQLGEPLDSELEVTPIEKIASDPDSWVGRVVKIQGEVRGVCARRGCWMDLVSQNDATLRVKVDDGVIVFPADAKGRQAVAEGEVEILTMERDAYEGWLRHAAEEEGSDFNPASVGEAPYRVVRLRGRGAEIHEL